MIKEILEYGAGPEPIPRLPMSAYPMGMVPGISDQISDHLRRNWLYYLLGGGMLFGPGISKKNKYLDSVNKRDSKIREYETHQAAYEKDPDAYLNSQYANFGTREEKEKAFQADQLQRQNDISKHHINAEKHAQEYNNSLGAKLPFIGGQVDPNDTQSSPGNVFGGGNTSGIDAVEKAETKKFMDQHKKAYDKVGKAYEDYIKANPNATHNEAREHIRNLFQNDSDINHDIFSDKVNSNGNPYDIDHFFDRYTTDRENQKAADAAKDQAKQQQQKQQEEQNKQNLIDKDHKTLNDDDKLERFKMVLNNDPELKDNYNKLNNWSQTFQDTQVPDHPLMGFLKRIGVNIPGLKDYFKEDPNKTATPNERRLNTLANSMVSLSAMQGGEFAKAPTQAEIEDRLLSRLMSDPTHAAALSQLDSKGKLNYILDNTNNSLDHLEKFHDDDINQGLANIFGKEHGITADHIKALRTGKSYSDFYQPQNNQSQNNQSQTDTGAQQAQNTQQTPNYTDYYNNLDDKQKKLANRLFYWNKVKFDPTNNQEHQDLHNSVEDWIKTHKNDYDFLKNDSSLVDQNGKINRGNNTFNTVAQMYHAASNLDANNARGLLTNFINDHKYIDDAGNTTNNATNPNDPSKNYQQSSLTDLGKAFQQRMTDRVGDIINKGNPTASQPINQNSQPNNNASKPTTSSRPTAQDIQNISGMQQLNNSNTNINDLVHLSLTENEDEINPEEYENNDKKSTSSFLKKHGWKILSGLGALGVAVGRNHLQGNAHEMNARFLYHHGNRDLADSEMAKANVKRSIDPIFKIKQYWHSRQDS